ncbi:MAG: amino acid permease [Clostridia bacterium]|nr:amino acid permease [Clostridia bacterium]
MDSNTQTKLGGRLSPFNAWAFALGTAVGWGSLVVTANNYLGQAGPMGSVLGIVLGTLIMLIVARNYAYMMQIYPDAGGAYTFSREVFGYDHGFLTGWFLTLTYLAVLWANATSIPLFTRYFLGGVLQIGKMYTIFGYDVYFGETLVTIAVILATALLCMRDHKLTIALMTGLACLFFAGIAGVFAAAMLGLKLPMQPQYIPDASALSQIVKIAVITPWAFIGFESISHRTEEFAFPHRKIFRVMVAALIATGLLYAFVTLLSVTAYPDRYGSWLEYIRDRGNLSGIEALPAFYAAHHYLGEGGVWLLMASLMALILTSLIGNTTCLSRLFYAQALDGILPKRIAELNDRGIPANAMKLIAAVSAVVPFVGRTAIGWIVDVTTIGATLIYGFVSAAAFKTANSRRDRIERWTGLTGLGLMIAFGLYILLPNLVSYGSMERETYFLFVVWSVLGFLFFRAILRNDREKRFGNSVVVWIALLSLVLLISLIWMRQSMIVANDQMMASIKTYYAEIGDASRMADEAYIVQQADWLDAQNTRTLLMAIIMFSIAVAMMFSNHAYLSKRANESEQAANIDPMTGVKSKHAFLKKERDIDAAIAGGVVREFAIAVCDVNGLKKINDTLGHKAGDEYICKASRLICEIFKHSPVYRTGGDEFVVILTDRDYAVRKELMKVLHDQSVSHISTGGVVVSGGLSGFVAGEDVSFHQVFERADALMYEEKQLLKGLGSISRDENPEEEKPAEEASILNVRKKVLVAEDDAVNRMMLGNVIETDYDVLYAEDGIEAMHLVDSHRSDLALMLLDLQMPRMNGLEVLKAIKEDRDLRQLPIIVLTADQDAELECLKIGAVDFIPKPYPAWEIVKARVDRCIELSESRETIKSTERDGLTRLYNIDYFLRYVNLYDQHYPDMAMDAVVVDINQFHMLNERYGKSYADEILRKIGERIRLAARKVGGVGCRQGADTFLLYCPFCEDYAPLMEQLAADVAVDKSAADRVRLRMGVYSQVDKTLDIERRFDRAKMAADAVKGGQSKAIGVYDAAMHEAALFRDRLLEDFNSSIESRRFKVYFQPKFDIRPDKPVLSSAEALVRWDHPELGMICPAVFIPLLEESGMILELDRFVWREAAARIREWKDKFGFAVPVSVNVSRIDMLNPNLKSIFNEILSAHRLGTEDFMLEITESAYTGESDQVLSTARELRGMGMGFRIEMDDFGTGYSSLGMLTKLPIDALKLDMSFVRSAFGERRDVRMIELIIDIADYLRVPVVAEGVETEEQLLALKALGCDYVQGYYFSKPVPAAEFERFLVERGKESAEITPEVRKRLSLSGALSSNYEHVYYIDTHNDCYLEFHTGSRGGLEIRPGGTDFFRDAPVNLLGGVSDEDAGRIREALRRGRLTAPEGHDPVTVLTYHRMSGGTPRPYCLQVIPTRVDDDHHIMIGVRPE